MTMIRIKVALANLARVLLGWWSVAKPVLGRLGRKAFQQLRALSATLTGTVGKISQAVPAVVRERRLGRSGRAKKARGVSRRRPDRGRGSARADEKHGKRKKFLGRKQK